MDCVSHANTSVTRFVIGNLQNVAKDSMFFSEIVPEVTEMLC